LRASASVQVGVLAHTFDLLFRQPAGLLDPHGLFLAGAEVLGRDVEDAVGVDVELDFDLRHAAGGWRDALQVELAQQPVVRRHLAFALEDPHGDGRLVVVGGAEDLLPLGGDRRVAFDQGRHHVAERLDAQRQRRHVQQQYVLHVAGQHAALDGCADGHHLVGVDPLVRVLAEDALDQLLDLGNPRGSAHQDDLVDLARLELGVLERLLHRPAATLDQAIGQLLELGSGDGHLKVFRAGGVGRDERQVDVGRLGRAEFFLGLFACLLKPLQRHGVLAQVDALLPLELIGHVVDQALVDVVAAEVGVAVGADHPEHAVGHLEHRDVEGPAAEVEHGDLLGLLPIQSVGQRGGRRLVDDPRHFQPRDLSGVFGGLALGIVEVGRHGDHGLVDLVAEVGLGRLLELAQRHRRDLRRRVLLPVDPDLHVVGRSADDLVGYHFLFGGDLVMPPAHETLDRIDGPFRVGNGLAPGGLADQGLALVGESNHTGGKTVTLRIGNDLGVFALHDSNDRVGGAQVDSDDLFAFSHETLLCNPLFSHLDRAGPLPSRSVQGRILPSMSLDVVNQRFFKQRACRSALLE